jgi:hypothetical protein
MPTESAAMSPPPSMARPPAMVPVRIAKKVAPSTSALPAGSSSRARWSGRMPYFTGPNSAPITPNRNSAPNRNGKEAAAKPAAARPATPISTRLRRRAIIALSYLSASCPPSPDRMKKGAMKTAPASVTSDSPCSPPIRNRMSRTSAFLRKLSLNAAKNCRQNRGAKRRENRRFLDMRVIQ